MVLGTLYSKRKKWVEANRENEFEDGIKRLLTDLYPDNAHFIYELLQNAEDPGATVVRFTLSKSSIEFEHNGRRLFSLADVESITSIGNSTKRNDATSIGKFGVGFKAVFAYTKTPEIHSGDFHFRIRDLVVPETDKVPTPRLGSHETRFVFPFDNDNKPSKKAVEEVKRGLLALGDNTLLFLTNIRKIEYLLPDGSLGTLERIEAEHGRIEIRAIRPDGTSATSHWLRFQKLVEVQEDDGKPKKCRVAVAYRLVEDELKGGQTSWKIVPLERGEVSIFFPAEKETSNLRFHIHAPFASTVARDSVRDCEANDQLFGHIAELVVESLAPIRDQGLLTVGFLATLPNPADNLAGNAPRYEPIRKALVAAFRGRNFTPLKLGGHAPSEALYRGPARILDVVSDDDLSLLTDHASPLWAANAPQANQREDRFIESLEIDAWGWNELTGVINSSFSAEVKSRIENWLVGKDDAWLMKFYALLGEAIATHHEFFYVPDVAMVRVSTSEGDQHVAPREAFFPPEGDEDAPAGVTYVKPSVYAEGRSKSQKSLARTFLENVGVRPFNPKTAIELRLQKYDSPPRNVTSEHYDDIKAFVSYWKSNPTHVNIFTLKQFLLGQGVNQSRYWGNATQLCMDRPYLETNLAGYVNAHCKRPVATEYFEKLGKTLQKDFVNFLKAIGVITELSVSKVSPCPHNPSWPQMCKGLNGTRDTGTRIVEDYTIANIKMYLSAASEEASQLIWCAILKADKRCAQARYRPNQQYTIREAESQLVHDLKSCRWIPSVDGTFHAPASITREELPSNFPFDDRNGLLTAIGLGAEARKRSQEYGARNDTARTLGFDSADEIDEFLALKKAGVTSDDLRKLLDSRQRTELPTEAAPDPERRRTRVKAGADGAPTNESIRRERAIQVGVSEVAAEAKAYLRAKYTNPNGQLVCQCCRQEMPFKLPAGEYYFEAVQCVPDKDKRHFQNRVALCPLCAAMYQVVRETGDDEVRSMLIQHEARDDAPSVEIPIRLAGQQFMLYFVGAHWFDLKTVL